MIQLNTYLTEKLKINKDTEIDFIDKKDYEYKFNGIVFKNFFKWYTGIEFKDADKSNIEEFIENSNLLKVYFDKDIQWCSDISSADFMRIKYLLEKSMNEKIDLYQRFEAPSKMYYCTCELSFLNKPITFYSMEVYDGPCDKKENLK